MRRLVLLGALLGAGFWVSEHLIFRAVEFVNASIVESTWALWLAWAVLALFAAGLIGRWRGLEGRRLAVTSVAAVLGAGVVIAITGFLVVLGLVPISESVGYVAFLLLYLVYAVETVAVSWLFAGISLRLGAHRTRP